MRFSPGDIFRHATWFLNFEPSRCEVVAVKQDAYKGKPIEIVQVREIGGTRTATYQQGRVPARGVA